MNHDFSDIVKHTLDGLSIIATVGALVNFLPALSALLSCVWLSLRIYESDTVQSILKRK